MLKMATSNPRYTITVTKELLQKVEDYHHNQRLSGKTEATIKLMEYGFMYMEEHNIPH
nr:MAG TPA: hypothetical protein [Bacteriophage sp.]